MNNDDERDSAEEEYNRSLLRDESELLKLCVHCCETIVREGAMLVCVRSGDDGGTYDFCEESPSETHVIAACQWFALCTNDAEGIVKHPILGDVPTCTRCADKAEETLHPFYNVADAEWHARRADNTIADNGEENE